MSCLIAYVYMHSVYMYVCGCRIHWLELFHVHYTNSLRRLKHRLASLDSPLQCVFTSQCIYFRMCPSSPFVCHFWSCTTRNCLTSFPLEKTLAPSSGYLRTQRERSAKARETLSYMSSVLACVQHNMCVVLDTTVHVHVCM